MPTLTNYRHFDGRHWETGSVQNYLACKGVVAPHTDQAYSEALLMGLSGGLLMGYFSFAYKGHDPHVALLSRNTFDPLDTLLMRLGGAQHVRQTSDAAKAAQTLLHTLAAGDPAIVWADAFSLPYNHLPFTNDMWAGFPILVYGYEPDKDVAWIADRAAMPLRVSAAELAAARGRIKKAKYRQITLDAPNPNKLTQATQQAIWDCLKRFTEAPVKQAAKNFGQAAFHHWANLLTNAKEKQSWANVFPTGLPMFAGLTSAYDNMGIGTLSAERDYGLYADFLAEASVLLNRPTLRKIAPAFRACAQAWGELGTVLLPDRVPPFKETRVLMLRQRQVFIEKGQMGLPECQQIQARLAAIRGEIADAFPLSEADAAALRHDIAAQVLQVGKLADAAHTALREAMSA